MSAAPPDPLDPNTGPGTAETAATTTPSEGVYSPRRQLALQGAAVILVLSLAWPYHGMTATPVNWQLLALAVGGTAWLFSRLSGQPWWWQTIHAIFAPLAWVVAQLEIDPGWFLIAFIGLLLVYRGALAGQVPLYLSSNSATEALAELIEREQARCILDLGAGIGSIVVPLARRFPERRFVGVEHSALPWLVGWLRTRGLANCEWRWQDLWATPLAANDLVYAFLSPVPMPRLDEKIRRDMRPGSLFVSNSFPIPDRQADLAVAAGAQTLYLYRV